MTTDQAINQWVPTMQKRICELIPLTMTVADATRIAIGERVAHRPPTPESIAFMAKHFGGPFRRQDNEYK